MLQCPFTKTTVFEVCTIKVTICGEVSYSNAKDVNNKLQRSHRRREDYSEKKLWKHDFLHTRRAKQIITTVPTVTRSVVFPYLCKGEACFAFASDSSDTLPIHCVCPACDRKAVPLDFTKPHEGLKHMGAHILFDPQYQHVSELCGLRSLSDVSFL
jgi:hypothetical protein